MHSSGILLVAIVATWGPPAITGHSNSNNNNNVIRNEDRSIRSRCPSVFEFRVRHDYYVYGLLTIPSPPMRRLRVPLLVTFQLRARLPTVSIPSPPPPNHPEIQSPCPCIETPRICVRATLQKYGGLIELRRSQNDTVADIRQRRPIQFIIHLPLQSPLPQLTLVLFDNAVLCGSVSPSGECRDMRLYHVLRVVCFQRYFSCVFSMPIPDVMTTFTATRPVVHRIEFRYAFNTMTLEQMSEITTPTSTTPTRRPIDTNVKETVIVTTTQRPVTTTQRIRFKPAQRCGQLHENFTSTPAAVPPAAVDSTYVFMERGSWPWLTAIYDIQSTAGPRFLCAGTLITPMLVVTARSCLLKKKAPPHQQPQLLNADGLLVMLGRHNMTVWFETGTTNRLLSAVHVPDEQHAADVAVLVLRERIAYGPYVMPLCLWSLGATDTDAADGGGDGDDVDVGPQLENVGTVVGWGSDARGAASSAVPVARTISIVPTAWCEPSLGDAGWERSFCAGARNADRTTAAADCGGHVGSGFVVLQNGRLALRGVLGAATRAVADAANGVDGERMMCTTTRNYYSFADVGEMEQWIEGFLE